MRRKCPQWFQDRLSELGVNPYGEPIFKLVWGESETFRVGGYSDGAEGYMDKPLGESAWIIMMWEPAIQAVKCSPYRWYKDHTDPDSGLALLGQYPYRGKYRVLKKLIHREFIQGQCVTTRMEPTHFILDVMIPMLRAWLKLSYEQKLDAVRQEMAAEEREQERIREDALLDKRIRRSSPLVQKKAELMERTMNQAMLIASRTQRGMMQIGA